MVRSGYKQTKIGIIPEDWNVDAIKNVTPTGMKYGIVDGPFGSNLKTIHYKSKGIPIITSGYVTEGSFYAKEYLYVTEKKFKQEKRSAVRGGDIVMAKIGARCGASAILPKKHTEGILSGNALKITIDENRHNTYFVWQLLWDLYTRKKLDDITTVGAQPAISMANLKEYFIPLPATLDEQNMIAQTLSDVDGVIDALEKQIAKKRDIKTATMQQLLTGKKRLPGFGDNWNCFHLDDLFDITAGKDLVKNKYSPTIGDNHPYPIYANSIFDKGIYGYSSFYENEEQCVTISARGTLGVAFYRPSKFVAIGRLLVLKPVMKINSYFVSEVINHTIEFASESTGVPQLTAPQCAKYQIYIPELSEQNAIAKILWEMDKEVDALNSKLSKTNAIKQGMMQELLTGRTRLI